MDTWVRVHTDLRTKVMEKLVMEKLGVGERGTLQGNATGGLTALKDAEGV